MDKRHEVRPRRERRALKVKRHCGNCDAPLAGRRGDDGSGAVREARDDVGSIRQARLVELHAARDRRTGESHVRETRVPVRPGDGKKRVRVERGLRARSWHDDEPAATVHPLCQILRRPWREKGNVAKRHGLDAGKDPRLLQFGCANSFRLDEENGVRALQFRPQCRFEKRRRAVKPAFRRPSVDQKDIERIDDLDGIGDNGIRRNVVVGCKRRHDIVVPGFREAMRKLERARKPGEDLPDRRTRRLDAVHAHHRVAGRERHGPRVYDSDGKHRRPVRPDDAATWRHGDDGGVLDVRGTLESPPHDRRTTWKARIDALDAFPFRFVAATPAVGLAVSEDDDFLRGIVAARKYLARRGQRPRRIHRVVTGFEAVQHLEDLALGGDGRRRKDPRRALAYDNAKRRASRRLLDERACLFERLCERSRSRGIAKLHRSRGVDDKHHVLVHPRAAEKAQFREKRTGKRQGREDKRQRPEHEKHYVLEHQLAPLEAQRVGEKHPRAPQYALCGALSQKVQDDRGRGRNESKEHPGGEERHHLPPPAVRR